MHLPSSTPAFSLLLEAAGTFPGEELCCNCFSTAVFLKAAPLFPDPLSSPCPCGTLGKPYCSGSQGTSSETAAYLLIFYFPN